LTYRKLQAENLAKAELQERREAREALKEAKEKEEREEKRRNREREDRKEQMSHVFQMKLLEAMTTSSKSEAPVRQHAQEERIELNLKLVEDQEDSDSFPTKIFCSNFEQLVSALRDFCGIGADKTVKVILFRMSRILDLVLLETGKTYNIGFKEKEEYIRIYMD
jgi:phage-related minor tail protein